MDRSPLEKWLGPGAIVAVVLLIVNVLLAYQNTRRLHEDAVWVTHTHDVIHTLDNVLSLAKDAETGQRGFLITGEDRHLAPYGAAIAAINRQVDDLANLTRDNPFHQQLLPELRLRISAKLDELSRTIALRKSGTFDDVRQVVMTDQGKAAMDALRDLVVEMTGQEEQLRAQRVGRHEHTFHLAVFEGLLSGACAILTVGAALALLRRHLRSRERAAFIIAEQGERLRTTLASIGDGVIATDVHGRVTMMNPVSEALTGWAMSDARGRLLTEVFHIVNETTRREVENPALRSLRDGVIVGLANHTILIAKDGVERAIDDSAAPIRCAKGELVGCVLVFRDITDHRKAEQAQARLAAIIDSSDDAIISKELDGTISSWNWGAERLFGYTASEAIGRSILILIPPDRGEEERSILDRIRRGVRIENYDTVRRRKDGSDVDISLTVSPIVDAAGAVVGASKIARDITGRKRAEEDLRRAKEAAETANIAKDNFLATLSHELRTPLTPVLATLGMWESARQLPADMRDDLSMIRRNIDLEARLIDDLLDLTRIVKGKLTLHLEVLDVQKLLDSVVGMYKSEINNKKIHLELHTQAEQCHVRADPGRLQQAFWNLLKNAVKFTPQGGRIDVSTRNDAHGHVQILVADTGIGINSQMLRRLFQPFEQETAGRYGGLGLGLAITKTLMDAQGGQIEAQSEGPGRGATFIITLPCVDAPAAEATLEPATDSGNNGEGAKNQQENCYRVLLVEDHPDTARVLARLLRGNGHTVSVADSVAQALAAVRTATFDVLVSDIGLPDGTGIDLIREIRRQQDDGKMPAIALTGFGMEDDVTRTREAGFKSHLTKPVNFARLEQAIQRVCHDAGEEGIDCPE